MFFKFINKYENEILRCAPPSHLWFFLIWLKRELQLVYKSYVGENSYCYYGLLDLIWAGNDEPFSVTPSISSGSYRYSVSGRPALATGSAGFFRFLGGAPTSIWHFFRQSVCRAAYLRNRTSSGHNFWQTYVKWWYLQVLFFYFLRI